MITSYINRVYEKLDILSLNAQLTVSDVDQRSPKRDDVISGVGN